MQGIRKSLKAGILSVIIAAAACGLLWVAFDRIGEMDSLRPLMNELPSPFWLSLFLLLCIGIYLSITPTNIDD